MGALINHGFDGKHHALAQNQSGTRCSHMQYLRFFMHFSADAMTTVLPDHAVTMLLGMPLYGVTDIANTGSWLNRFDAFPHGFVGDFYQPVGQR